jgi:uncharacterized RDD family membrane protein YckC
MRDLEENQLQEAPTSPLVAPSQITSPTLTLTPAGFFVRLAAFLIDSYIISLIIGFFNFLLISTLILISGDFARRTFSEPPSNLVNPWYILGSFLLFILIIILVDLLIPIVYFVLMTTRFGTTPGKELFKIKIVDQNGNTPQSRRIFLRETIGRSLNIFTLGISYLFVAFDKRKQGLHDKIAGTFAILSQPVEGVRKAAAIIIVSAQILLILGFILFYTFIMATIITGTASLGKRLQESKQNKILKDGQIENLLKITPNPTLPSYFQPTPTPTSKEATQPAQPKNRNPFEPFP